MIITRFANRPKGQSAAAWAALAESVIDSYAKQLAEPARVTCVYCGHQYPGGTPESRHADLTAHISQCHAHPMRRLGEALSGLMGLPFPPSAGDLNSMQAGIAAVTPPDDSATAAAMSAIDALRVFVVA